MAKMRPSCAVTTAWPLRGVVMEAIGAQLSMLGL
jgi:hypothetical protein